MSTAASKDQALPKMGFIDIVKHRWIYLAISALITLPGLFFMVDNIMNLPSHTPVRLGIDFVGGSMVEYGFHEDVDQQDVQKIRAILDGRGLTGSVIQPRKADPDHTKATAAKGDEATAETEDAAALTTETPAATKSEAKTSPPSAKVNTEETQLNKTQGEETPSQGIQSVVSIRTKHLSQEDSTAITEKLKSTFGDIILLQRNSIGPSLASELLKNGLIALGLAYVLIVGYLSFRFQLDYAICAIIALVHDTLFVIGMFAMFGALYGTEVDSLFVTGILTVVGFSVHDTIVVFDRLRENSKVYFSKKLSFGTIANISLNQTLARSINTSLTAMLTLLALYFFGGETTRDFTLCMILGIAVGTYSSIFVASALLTMWREMSVAPASSSSSSGKKVAVS